MIVNWKELCSQYNVSISWNSFIYDTSKSIQYHIDNLMLSEDLLQIVLNKEKNIIFDVGYPDFLDENGFFHIYIIKNFDWDHPLEHYITRSIFEVENLLKTSLEKYSQRSMNR